MKQSIAALLLAVLVLLPASGTGRPHGGLHRR